jgi:hypothetical protein
MIREQSSNPNAIHQTRTGVAERSASPLKGDASEMLAPTDRSRIARQRVIGRATVERAHIGGR